MKVLAAIAEPAGLAPIDLHLADLMRRRTVGEESQLVEVTAALLSRERRRGHSCIDLDDWAGRPLAGDGGPATVELPEREAWKCGLARSGLAGGPDCRNANAATPLVLDGAGRVFLRRFFLAEQRVAGALRDRLRRASPEIEGESLALQRDLFRKLFPGACRGLAAGATAGVAADWQAVAAAAALRGRMTLISGGPGTGKTTTVTRILALLLAGDPELRIALAAPTGKAAARLGESIADQLATLPVAEGLRARIPRRASTLHRLLEYLPRSDHFRRHPGRPLACDLLVLDEASMVDLLLIDAALAALPDAARVILLGDRDQLASVETGVVFGDLCAAAGLDRSASGTYSAGFAEFYRRLAGDGAVLGGAVARDDAARFEVAGDRPPYAAALHDAAVELRRSYRFRGRRGIGVLAAAIREQDAPGALDVLCDGERPEVDWRQPPQGPREVLAPLVGDLESYLAAATPSQALRRLGRFRILCATRHGPWGVEGLGAAVEQELLRRGLPGGDRWYRGRPVLITANDYQVGLFNGDLGVCWPAADRAQAGERLFAWFQSGGGRDGDETGLRRLPLARVPAHATAWAMTVHKSQGSEFERVLLTLPEADMQLLTRELLYTGVTRARQHLHLVATAATLRAAILRRHRRASGLTAALLGGEPAAETAPSSEAEPPLSPAVEPKQLSLF